jgi:hypothetical protein
MRASTSAKLIPTAATSTVTSPDPGAGGSWSTIHERITRFEPPHSFDYVLFKGMPALRSHSGTVSVDHLSPDRSRLNWNVDFVFRTVHPFRLLLPSFLRQFEGVLPAGVENLRGQLQSGIEHAHH